MTTHASAADRGDPNALELGMQDLTKQFDWAATSLGPRDRWSVSLRVMVDAMLASGNAMCIMWGPERVFLYNDAYAPILAGRHPTALGQPTASVWPELWDDIRPLVDRTFAGETVTFQEMPLTMTRHGYEEETWWSFSYSPIWDEDGEIAGLLNVTADSTPRILAERQRDAVTAELSERERFMSSVLAASTDCIKVIELDGTLSFMSEGGMGVMEISDFNSVKGCPWPDFLKEDGPDYARAAIEAAKHGKTTHFDAPADTALGTPRHWAVSVSPIPGPAGEVARILSVSRDITELERSREQQRLLNGELAHRIKNTMSVVQAIAFQTLGKVTDREAVQSFEDRLTTLARSHDVLTGQHWNAAKLDAVVASTLRTFGEERFEVSGPEVAVGPRTTLSLTLMLHELATNAVKYGALSVPTGKVAVRWGVQPGDEEELLEFTWSEQGGPPAAAPARKGFGSRIIRMGLTGSGGVDLDYATKGLTVKACAPLYQIQEA